MMVFTIESRARALGLQTLALETLIHLKINDKSNKLKMIFVKILTCWKRWWSWQLLTLTSYDSDSGFSRRSGQSCGGASCQKNTCYKVDILPPRGQHPPVVPGVTPVPPAPVPGAAPVAPPVPAAGPRPGPGSAVKKFQFSECAVHRIQHPRETGHD